MSIRVIIADKNSLFSSLLETIFQSEQDIHVVATSSVSKLDEKLYELKPDAVIYDIDAQKKGDIDSIKKSLNNHSIPFIFVSNESKKAAQAKSDGACDFITKPSNKNNKSAKEFVSELIAKLKTVCSTQTKPIKKTVKIDTAKENIPLIKKDIIAIGASTGGTEAVLSVLKQLPKNSPGIVVVQHIPPKFSSMFANRLNEQTHFDAKEATNADEVKRGHVYLAPGDKHIRLKKRNKSYILDVYKGEKVSGHCPSVDVLFNSVADICGDKSVGVILTGMGQDGAKGLLKMRKSGAFTIGQDEESCVVYGMPKVAYNLGGVCKQCSLDFMGYNIIKQLKQVT